MVVFLWCGCGGVLVVVFLWRCFCGGVLVVVFLWWCTKPPVLLRTTPVLLRTTKYYSSTTPYYKVLLQYYSVLQSTTPVLLRTTKYYSSTTPILLCTTKYYSSTTPYYRALLRPLKRRQNDVLPVLLRTTPVLQKLPKRTFRAMLPPNFTERASKRIVSCEASDNSHRKSFQNDHFVGGFLQISQNELPKRAFRAMLPTILTEKASKMIISCEASSKFHRTVLPKRAFRAMLPTIFTQNLRFATVSRDRHTDSCERVHPPKAKCTSHYSAVHSQISKCTLRYSGVRKNV